MPRLVLVVSLAAAVFVLGAGSAAAATLWNQLNNQAGAGQISSQNFEPDLDFFDSQAADDFVVPAGEMWRVRTVRVQGTYYNGSGPADGVNVVIYRQAQGKPGGIVEYSASGIVPSSGLDTGSFVIPVSPAARLHAGTYWLMVQAEQQFGSGVGQWGWWGRSVRTGAGAVWRNPLGGFGIEACATFQRRAAVCEIDKRAPDQMFRLTGTIEPVT